MTEAELLAEVTALCDRLGLLWHHDSDSRKSQGTPGFPDLVIIGTSGVLFAELKSEDGETSADQDRWAYNLHHAFDAYSPWRLWKPSDWHRGFIREELAGIAQPPI